MDGSHSFQDYLGELEEQRNANRDLYIPVPMEPERTLLLMGPTRAGKSTIFEALQNSLYQPDRPTLYSATRKPDPRDVGGLRIIDMPGFNDLQTQSKYSISNMEIFEMLKQQLNDNDPVHLFAFVFSLHGGINIDDINAMARVQSELPHLAGRTILVVTHAEELDDRNKTRLVKEFFSHPLVNKNNLQNFFQKEIFFLGCLRYESFNKKDEEAIGYQHQNVLEMRKKFIKKCFDPVPPLNQQRSNNKSSFRFVFPSIISLIVIFGILYLLPGFYFKNIKIGKRGSDEALNVSDDKVSEQEHLLLLETNEHSDDTEEQSSSSSTSDTVPSESKKITSEVLYNNMEDTYQALQNYPGGAVEFRHLMFAMEDALKILNKTLIT